MSLGLGQLGPGVPDFLGDHPAGFVLVLAHPAVGLDLLQTHAFGGVAVEDLADEVHHFSAEVDGELDVHLQDLVVGLVLVRLALEGRPAGAELVAEHSQAPHVCPFVVELTRHDLGGHVVESTAEGLALAA